MAVVSATDGAALDPLTPWSDMPSRASSCCRSWDSVGAWSGVGASLPEVGDEDGDGNGRIVRTTDVSPGKELFMLCLGSILVEG